jgi:hypothetical protein
MPGSFQAVLALFALSWMSQNTLACNWEAVRHSTAYIFADVVDQETGAKSSIQGTGFVVSRLGYVLTDSHVLRAWMKQRKADKEQYPIRATLWDRPGRWAAASSFAEGMSGGPVYNSSCNLIGLVKGGLVNSAAAQWVTPIGHAENFLRIAGVNRECVHNARRF